MSTANTQHGSHQLCRADHQSASCRDERMVNACSVSKRLPWDVWDLEFSNDWWYVRWWYRTSTSNAQLLPEPHRPCSRECFQLAREIRSAHVWECLWWPQMGRRSYKRLLRRGKRRMKRSPGVCMQNYPGWNSCGLRMIPGPPFQEIRPGRIIRYLGHTIPVKRMDLPRKKCR